MTVPARDRTGMVRSHTPTEGAAEPTRATLDEATLLFADATVDCTDLSVTAHRVMDLVIPGALSIAETSAYLKLPAAVAKVIAAALVESGHLIARSPAPAQQRHDPILLERILSGLRNL